MPEPRSGTEQDWAAHLEREESRYRDGESRLPEIEDADARQRQLTRLGNAAGGAGLALLMQGRPDEAADWFHRAAARYRESFADAPPTAGAGRSARSSRSSWPATGRAPRRPHGGRSTPEPREAQTPIGRYAAALAALVLGDDVQAREHADAIRTRDDFPQDVGDALAYLAAQDVVGYIEAIEDVLESFDAREEYLEDVPVADTVLVLQALARRRGLEAELSSPLLP